MQIAVHQIAFGDSHLLKNLIGPGLTGSRILLKLRSLLTMGHRRNQGRQAFYHRIQLDLICHMGQIIRSMDQKQFIIIHCAFPPVNFEIRQKLLRRWKSADGTDPYPLG